MSGSAPVVAFFCATYLKPEMHHVYRQITSVDGWRPIVLAQKVENREAFPLDELHVVPRSPLRFFGRAVEKHLTGEPWQISRDEMRRLRRELEQAGAGVLHVFFGNVAIHLLPLLESVELPVVVSFHGADVTGAIATPAYRAARDRLFGMASLVACRSAALADEVEKLGCPRAQLRLVPTVLPEIAFHERRLPADGSFRLVQASRLVPKKGVATSLRAFASLSANHPGMTLVIAGSGPMESGLRRLANDLGCASRVHFAGFLEEAALRDLLASAHVFLHPSETIAGDTEGVPNSLLEAMAGGLPVVATRHGGIPEAVEHGVSGLLCEEGDAKGVAEAVERLIGDASFYDSVARAGAQAVQAKFSRATVGRLLGALYAEAAG